MPQIMTYRHKGVARTNPCRAAPPRKEIVSIMSTNNASASAWFSQLEVSPSALSARQGSGDQAETLRDILAAQDRTNELLEELVKRISAVQRQKEVELKKWKEANPRLAESCRRAADALSRVQIEFLDRITEEVEENAEDMVYGDFMLNEFIDRFGPRLAHLNGVLQVLAQLSSSSNPTAAHQEDDTDA